MTIDTYIYKLTDEEKELISNHDLFFNDLFDYLDKILDIGFKETIEDYELTIYSIIYRILELLDTLKVMTDNSLINSAFIITRSLIEISVQLQFILLDNDTIEKKATVLQMLDIKRTTIDEDIFYKKMQNRECYKKYVSILKIEKTYINWYSYCIGKNTNIKELFKLVSLEDLYSNLYKPLCIETHQINHMESNIAFQDKKFNFKPFRGFENHLLLLNSVLKIMIPTLDSLMKVYGNKALKNDWFNYKEKLENYLKKQHDITEFVKIFNPQLKNFNI